MSDPIADTLIRIKNGYRAGKPEVMVRYSKVIVALCKILEEEGFVSGCVLKDLEIEVTLKYSNNAPALADVKRISKPGLRVYKGVKFLPYVLNGLGVAIVSTPKGIMTDKKARKLGLGGEVMAEVW